MTSILTIMLMGLAIKSIAYLVQWQCWINQPSSLWLFSCPLKDRNRLSEVFNLEDCFPLDTKASVICCFMVLISRDMLRLFGGVIIRFLNGKFVLIEIYGFFRMLEDVRTHFGPLDPFSFLNANLVLLFSKRIWILIELKKKRKEFYFLFFFFG